MVKPMDRERLGVEMPRYLASYAARERILKNVLARKEDVALPKWTKPVFSLAAAVALILLLVLPQLAPGISIFSLGSHNAGLARDWEQVARNYPNLKEIKVTSFEADLNSSTLRYRLRVVALDGPELVEFSLQRNGNNLTVERTVTGTNRDGVNFEVLSLLDKAKLRRLVRESDLAATMSLRLTSLSSPGVYFGESWSVINSSGNVQALAKGYLEITGEYAVLSVSQKGADHGYILPLESTDWRVVDLTYLYNYLQQFGQYSLTSISRQGSGWRVEVELSQTNAVLIFADSSFSSATHYLGREFHSQDVWDLLEGLGIEVVALEAWEREWIVSVRYRNREGTIRFSDADGSILYRSLPLVQTVPGTGFYIGETWYKNFNDSGLDFQSSGMLTGIVGVGQGALLEVRKEDGYALLLVGNGTIRSYASGEDVRLRRIAVAPDHKQGLTYDGSWTVGGQLNLDDKPLAVAWAPDSSQVAITTDSGIYLAKNRSSQATLISDSPGTSLVWLSTSLLAWVEGVQIKLFCLDSGWSETYKLEGETRYRLGTSGGHLVVTGASQGKGSVYIYQNDSFSMLMPEVEIANSEAFLESIAFSEDFILYRSGEDYSALNVWSITHAKTAVVNAGLSTPVWLNDGRLALVSPGGVQYLDIHKMFD